MSRECEQPRMQTYMSREPAQSKRMSRFRATWHGNLQEIATPQSPERRRTLCASLRSRNACQNFTRQSKRMSRFCKSHFIRKFTGKWRDPKRRRRQCASRHSRKAYRDFTVSRSNISCRWLWQQEKRRRDKRRQEVERRETLCTSLRASQNEPRTRTAQIADIHFERAGAVETHVKISQEPLYTEIYRKNAVAQNGAADIVRAGIVERNVKILQEPLDTEICR